MLKILRSLQSRIDLINEVEVAFNNSDQGGDGDTDLQHLTKMIFESNFFGVSLTGTPLF